MNNKSLRAATVALLDGNTTATDKVYNSTVYPNIVDDLPAINITTPTVAVENLDHLAEAGAQRITLQIDCVVAALDGANDDLDDLVESVKTLLFTESFADTYGPIESYAITTTPYLDAEKPVFVGSLQIVLEPFEAY